MSIRFLPLLLVLLASPVASTPVGPITDVVVVEQGLGPAKEGCRSFELTPKQARAFFDKAVLISARQQHDNFLYGPCFARGTFKNRFDTWQWEIRSLGTATITATNGEVFVLGDPGQVSTLAEDA
jgi:hypothetical protein